MVTWGETKLSSALWLSLHPSDVMIYFVSRTWNRGGAQVQCVVAIL